MRLATMYGTECQALNKKKEKINVPEITMFKSTRSVNRFDRIKNECAGRSLGITNMAKKMRDRIC